MQTKDIIKKYKEKNKEPDSKIWLEMMSMAEDILKKKIEAIEEENKIKIEKVINEITDISIQWIKDEQKTIDETVNKYIQAKKIEIKGDKGDTYNLTIKDKQQIASAIKVPIVEKIIEKREIIKEQPIIKNQIVEKIDKTDTGEDIVKKINTQDNQKIKINKINGLIEELTNIKKVIREKKISGGGASGGGMGNTIHESKSVGSTTTSIQTQYPVSGNGYAIWLYYQGQMIARGNSYTMSADRKTINLLFTPVDDTYIDIIYIR